MTNLLSSIGIIGGADGPTAILVAGGENLWIPCAAVLAAAVVCVLLVIRKRRRGRK